MDQDQALCIRDRFQGQVLWIMVMFYGLGLGFMDQGKGLWIKVRCQGLGFMDQGKGLGLGVRVQVLWIRVRVYGLGLGFRVRLYGLG